MSRFLTPWEYNSHQEHRGKTYHVWECQHCEGYTAFALTFQPEDPRVSFVKPMRTGHYVGKEGLKNKTGIEVVPNAETIRD